ncbi:MAG: tRNA (adenosine(37)-N6)-threonylcarbamoyltransferase complex dimerization subunit type 1 TsaB [Rickettsiales bacterium]|nr:tRNA (adenosine(37)-N6)-threonylcarbamoyltransferase complex dimerization subunit type 1 TsaB [Rickettsiales bacterium]
MKILAFDTTNSTLSVAILEDSKVLAKNTIYESGKQSELLIPEIEKVLKKCNIWYEDLNYIAATSGPGSFTGIRIGLSVARTLKIATNLPLILLDSLEVLAFKHREKSSEIFVTIDAKMDEFFIASFKENKQILKSQLVKIHDVSSFAPKSEFILCGSGKKIIAPLLTKNNFQPIIDEKDDVIEADLVGLLAYEKICNTEEVTTNNDALYLRKPQITKRKK